MKKWIAGVLSAVMCVSFPVMSSLAYAPTESDFANVYGSTGCETTADADGNTKLVFNKDSGWAGRLSYMEPVKLDGLEITLTGVEVDVGAAPTLGLGNEQGQWVDSNVPLFIHYNHKKSDTLGAVEHGFLLGKDYMDDGKPRMINETAFTGALSPEMKLSFNKKDDSTWTYTVNGQAFDFDASHLSSLNDLDNVYLNFGNWTQGSYSTSFVVANIKEDRPTTTTTEPTTPAPTTTTKGESSAENSTAPAPSSNNKTTASTQAGEISDPGTSADEQKSGSNIALYIVLAVVVLACIGAGVFIVIKYVVKKPTDTPPDDTPDSKPEE